jgi:hypothetical protein
MNSKYIPAVFVLFVLVSCSSNIGSSQGASGTTVPTTTSSPTISTAQTPSPTVSSKSSITPVEISKTPTYLAGVSMKSQCLQMQSPTTGIRSLNGLVLVDKKSRNAYYWNRLVDTKIYLPYSQQSSLRDIKVSPDHKHILLYDVQKGSDRNLMIVDNSAIIIWTKAFDPDHEYYGWFDDHRLWQYKYGGGKVSDQFNLIDPFNGVVQELKVDFPFADSTLYSHWNLPVTIYDPSLTRVIYFGCDKRCTENSARGGMGWPVFLYNIETNKIIASFLTQDNFGYPPLWRPNGSAFIMAADLVSEFSTNEEFFSVSRDGDIRQLTHLHDDFPQVEISDNYGLSPDGNSLAFWLRVPPDLSVDPTLIVLDTQSGNLLDYCIHGFPYNTNPTISNYPAPIWSPDGKQLVVQTRDPQTSENSLITLIDLTQITAVQVKNTDNIDPVGWLSLP